jgi:hypothetical protein
LADALRLDPHAISKRLSFKAGLSTLPKRHKPPGPQALAPPLRSVSSLRTISICAQLATEGEFRMATNKRLVWTAIRWIYGLFFLLTGIWIALSVTTDLTSPPDQPTSSAAAFMDALSASGFMDQVLAISFVGGGALLLFNRTAPAGLLILAPPVTVILLFHLMLSGQAVVGVVVAAVFVALAWHYRRAFAPLWTWQVDGAD